MSFPPMKLSSPTQLVLLSLLALLLFSYFSGLAGGISVGSHNNITCIDEEREALLEFKQGIQVDNCGLLSSWGDQEDNRDCCQWHGVRCSNRTGRVIMLDLHGVANAIDPGDPNDPYNRCLQGTVSPSIVELKHLKYLDLSSNYFQGHPIPSFIGSLIHLHHLNLSNAGFQGIIPHQLGNLSKLASLDLSRHYDDVVYGRSSLQWLSQLTSLRDINLSGNNLSQATDWLHIVNNLPFLRVLQMEDCHLSIPMPSSPMNTGNSSTTYLRVLRLGSNNLNDTSIFQWLFNLSGITTQLVHVDLSENQLPGPIPSYFGNLHSLAHLDLGINYFQGQIPGSLGNMLSLSYLDLHGNQLEGPIPSTISNIKLLAHLDLSSNSFQGSGYIPNVLSKLCSLQFLSLDNNNLTDALSAIINALSRCPEKALVSLDLGTNKFWGSVPDTISELSILEGLYLQDNQLEGTLSNNHFSNFSRLRALDLSGNPKLVLNITADFVPPFQLDIIYLSNCKLGPRFPEWLGTQRNFSVLDISNNGITDTIPDFFWRSLSSNLQDLDVSGNMIYGVIQDSSITFRDSPRIDLSSNRFKGAIPLFLRNVSSLFLASNKFSDLSPFFCPKTNLPLQHLDLSNNLFSGELPDCWMYFDQLLQLNLENNNFSGSISASISALHRLWVLQLRNNSLSGELPTPSFKNCTSLAFLDLGYNLLAGYIPSGIGTTMKRLVLLIMRNNKFHGEVPLSICQMPHLQILDLSFNHISGAIPNCIHNLTSMTTQTDLADEITDFADYFIYSDAEWVMWKRKEQSFGISLQQLKGIDVSENKLEGRIPEGISSLFGLVFLNLSGNNLEGSITPRIGQLTSLQFLDLSDNRLSGEIPTTLANLNFLEILDLSNNNLSGKIPLGSTQLQTFDASSYAGNPKLCGDPLPKKCPGDQGPINPSNGDNITQQDENDSDDIYPGLYISVVLGFIVGFWGVCGTLVIKRSWRHSFFRFFDDMKDRLYVMVVVNLAGAWRRRRI